MSILDLRRGDASARADVKHFPHHIKHLECKLAGIHQVTLIPNVYMYGFAHLSTFVPLIKFKERLLTLQVAHRCSQSRVLPELNSTREKS